MTTIAILGSGAVARALTCRLRDAGHELIVGSRAPREDSAVPVVGLREAAGVAEVVINALPGPVSVEVLTGLAAELAGKVLVDVANATESDARGFAAALLYPGGSLAEEIQRALPEVRVVKTLNTMHESIMAQPDRPTHPPTAFLSGNDADAKKAVGGLLADLGWAAEWVIDLGGVETARVPEAFMLMVGDLVRALGPVPFGMAIAH
ncbi:NAD(P)-binding domain-containing protein [Nonomuraea sp. NPDC050680]|uniref:NADPH-dependent F420 reductase n=1 Tax=Nonomuraea sp. NPDC050680 TaxID=3154630 RepID=UPI0033C14063